MEYYGDTLEQAVSAAVNREKKNSNSFRLFVTDRWTPWVPVIPNVRLRPSNEENPIARVSISYESLFPGNPPFEIEVRADGQRYSDYGAGSLSFDIPLDSVTLIDIRARSEIRQDIFVDAEAF